MTKAKLIKVKYNGEYCYGFKFTEQNKEGNKTKTITSISYFTKNQLIDMKMLLNNRKEL